MLIATTNPGKLVEMEALFSDFPGPPLKLISLVDIDLVLDVKEDGQTYQENASKKAMAYSLSSCMLTLADDSGVEVEVLDGRPGIYSARYSGKPDATDADRRAFLLNELSGYSRPWKARFCCVVAVGLPDGRVYTCSGQCQGEIIPEERGTSGFGYDPIFQFSEPGYAGYTMAELGLEEKNQISHRARAVRAAFPIVERLLRSG